MSASGRAGEETAVALRYEGRGAPRVTAKGRGLVACEILRRAREHGVPISEDPHLARLLAQVELGEEIPEALYEACAQVIAFAYYLKGKGPRRGHRPEPEAATLTSAVPGAPPPAGPCA